MLQIIPCFSCVKSFTNQVYFIRTVNYFDDETSCSYFFNFDMKLWRSTKHDVSIFGLSEVTFEKVYHLNYFGDWLFFSNSFKNCMIWTNNKNISLTNFFSPFNSVFYSYKSLLKPDTLNKQNERAEYWIS